MPTMIKTAITIVLALLAASVHAQALKILSAGAMKPAVLELVPAFEAKHGVKVDVINDTAGALVKRIEAGESFDVAFLTPAGLETLAAKAKIDPASVKVVGRVGIGVAVSAGAPHPPLQTVEQFKAALQSAKKIALIDPSSGGSSGIYLDGLFDRWGIRDAIRAKAVFLPGGLTAEKIVKGEADLAIQQASELMVVPGVELAGFLPDAVQNYTSYGYGIATNSQKLQLARAFVTAASSSEAGKIFRTKGVLPAQ